MSVVVTPATIEKTLERMAFWLKRWKRYPLGYVIECLGETPTYQQAEVLNDLAKYGFVAVASGHGIGKTKLLAWLVHWYLDTHYEPGKLCRVPITGAAFDQLKDCLWSEISAVKLKKAARWPWLADRYELQSSGMYFNREWKDGWFATLRTAREENPDALQGFHDCFFVIDEWSGVPDSVFEVARGAMGDPGCKGIMMGNPTTNSGYGYNVFTKGSEVWKCRQYSSLDSMSDTEYSYLYVNPMGEVVEIKHFGRQTRKWADDMARDFGIHSSVFKVRVLGQFGSLNADSVIGAKWLLPVWTNPKPEATGRRIMALDVARSGNDDSSLVVREGREVQHVESWHGADLVETRLRVMARQSEWKCHKIGVDIIGVGAGVYDELRFLKYPVYPVTVSAAATDGFMPKCKSLRDELWWKGNQFFRQAGVKFAGDSKDPEWAGLAEELQQPTYTFRNGAIVVESKDEMKARGARSPNRADAFLMTLMDEDFTGAQHRIVVSAKATGARKKRRSENWKTM